MTGKYRIKVENDSGESIEVIVRSDSNAEDWLNTFRVILSWATFTDATIREILRYGDNDGWVEL